MTKPCVWQLHRDRINQAQSLQDLVVRRQLYIKRQGLPFKTKETGLDRHYYNRDNLTLLPKEDCGNLNAI